MPKKGPANGADAQTAAAFVHAWLPVRNVSHEYTPHACFKFTSASPATDEADLRAVLRRELRAEFDSMRTVSAGWLATLMMVLPGTQDSYAAVLGRSQFEEGEWILIVGPPNTPGWIDRLRGRRPESNADLALTCIKIHTVLAGLPGIRALRWYFEGPRSQSEAVSTPDELPWPQIQ